jgi:hypothetical protein
MSRRFTAFEFSANNLELPFVTLPAERSHKEIPDESRKPEQKAECQ